MDSGSSDRPLRFSAVFFPPKRSCCGGSPMTRPVKLYNFTETDLKEEGFDLQKFHRADVHIHREEPEEMNPNLHPPGSAVAYCPVSRSFLIVGGDVLSSPFPNVKYTPIRSLWSFCAADAPQPPSSYTWGIRATMSQGRSWGWAVPYDGLVYILGGEKCPQPSVEIYDPRSGRLDPPVLLSGDASDLGCMMPYSYFLWRDSSKPPHKKPLIMLHGQHHLTGCNQLLSFDVEKKHLEIFDSKFPRPDGLSATGMTRLLPLEGTNTLLIMEDPDLWLVYDLSSQKEIGSVEFVGFEWCSRDVIHGFCRRCWDGSHIVYMFMDGFDYGVYTYHSSVPYAKFRFQKEEDGRFVATLESRGFLGNGNCRDFFIFADQIAVPEEAPHLPLSGPGKRRRRG